MIDGPDPAFEVLEDLVVADTFTGGRLDEQLTMTVPGEQRTFITWQE
jgi:hypothetical protein